MENNFDNKENAGNDVSRIVSNSCCECGEKKAKYIEIVDCFLCKKCNKKLSDSFEYAMNMDRTNDPEL